MFYKFANKGIVKRSDPCCACFNKSGNLVGKIDYLGLEKFNFIQCPDCGLISVDPVPSIGVVAKGCTLLYSYQQRNESKVRIQNGFGRSYRKGRIFAESYLKQGMFKDSIDILEVGAGDGYFSQGIKSIYDTAKITYIDVVESLVSYYKAYFECNAICGEFSAGVLSNKKYDLIIARDLFEHLLNPVSFLKEARETLKENGCVFIITPNGFEEFWLINQRFIRKNEATKILLNHFHYFLPETLDFIFRETRFNKHVAFKFDLNGYKLGLGVKDFTEFREEEFPPFDERLSKVDTVMDFWSHDPKRIKGNVLNNGSFVSRIYSKFKDREKDIVDYYDPRGHEFFLMLTK